MEEARRVIERLDRIEALNLAGAPRREVAAEMRALLREGEEWLAAERGGTERASDALERCRLALAREEEPAATAL